MNRSFTDALVLLTAVIADISHNRTDLPTNDYYYFVHKLAKSEQNNGAMIDEGEI